MTHFRQFVDGGIYHVFTRSIAGFEVFRYESDFVRMLALMRYYQYVTSIKFSDFIKSEGLEKVLHLSNNYSQRRISILAYCLMPNHFHLIVKQEMPEGITHFMTDVLISFSCYFNKKIRRKGPLWEGRFKSVSIDSDSQLLHLTRYIHLNPVTAYMVTRPDEWRYSSCNEYLDRVEANQRICYYSDVLDIVSNDYYDFLMDRIDYQRELKKLKNIIID